MFSWIHSFIYWWMNINYCIGAYFKIQMFQMHLTIDENNSHQPESHNFAPLSLCHVTSFHLDTFGSTLTFFAGIVNITFVFWNLLFVINKLRLVDLNTDFKVNLVILNILYIDFVFTLQFVYKTSKNNYKKNGKCLSEFVNNWAHGLLLKIEITSYDREISGDSHFNHMCHVTVFLDRPVECYCLHSGFSAHAHWLVGKKHWLQ